MSDFCTNLKTLRKSRGLTQREFAKIFDISNGTIAQWETGRNQPDMQSLINIAKYFNVTVDYLLGNVNEPDDYIIKTNDTSNAFNKKPVFSLSERTKHLSEDSRKELEEYIEFLENRDRKKGRKKDDLIEIKPAARTGADQTTTITREEYNYVLAELERIKKEKAEKKDK